MRDSIRANPATPAADFTHPAMRTWLQTVPAGSGLSAGFETRIWWSPGSSAKKIAEELQGNGYRAAAAPERFIVTGRYGPLKPGEIERAKTWGARLADSVRAASA
jgi:hypothetical protein